MLINWCLFFPRMNSFGFEGCTYRHPKLLRVLIPTFHLNKARDRQDDTVDARLRHRKTRKTLRAYVASVSLSNPVRVSSCQNG